MAVNPASKREPLNSPVARANKLNDPQFENQQGYFPYDLTHQEFITPLFGHITPTMHLDTAPADRTVVHDNLKNILNQINGNLLSTVNQYVDSFYVPLRATFPNNYEKLIPNPVKGDDLPRAALPCVPLGGLFYNMLFASETINSFDLNQIFTDISEPDRTYDYIYENEGFAFYVSRLHLLSTILSRGQLLDYLGISFDDIEISQMQSSKLQQYIDNFHRSLYMVRSAFLQDEYDLRSLKFNSLISDEISTSDFVIHSVHTLSEYRSALSDIYEAGEFPYFYFSEDTNTASADDLQTFFDSVRDLSILINEIFNRDYIDSSDIQLRIESVNQSDLFVYNEINICKVLAYQMCVAHFFTNDSVDNIFSSELYYQLLRSVMYPADANGITSEPTFDYNGVSTEYDLMSYGGFAYALISNRSAGKFVRQHIFCTLMFLLRRSLRYGDYFSTARPNMLAVGQLSIPTDSNGNVSPIDVTKNLLMQRYLNAANYIGQGFLQYYASQFGIVPSDTGCVPRFIGHRKIEFENRVTTNMAEDQGKQTTNLVGYSDNNAFDVFIDDLGFLLSVTTFDVLPVYKSGIESTYYMSDRFDYFNPMLQNIGDQPIRVSELIGNGLLRNSVFGYTMRNSEYKYKLSRAHGAFVNSLPGFLLAYPLKAYIKYRLDLTPDLHISPDFIRDKPFYLDSVVPQMTGISPAEYYHFICSCTNQVLCARKIQATPPVLF